MEEIKTGFNWRGVILYALLGLALILFLGAVVPAHAEIFTYGSNPNYSILVLPNASYVHQGENISQGYYYDLSGVYGFTGKLAHWDWDDDVGMDTPDQINDIPNHRDMVYIDPAKYPVGRWFQCDTWAEGGDSICGDFGANNAYAFAVVPPMSNETIKPQVRTETRYKNITMFTNGEMKVIPVTYTVTITPEPVETPVSSATVETIIITPTPSLLIPTTEVTAAPEIVTPKAPLSLYLILISLIGGVALWRDGRK